MQDIPYGFCHCGCGEKTKLAKVSNTRNGHVRGEPVRYLVGHHRRIPVPDRLREKTYMYGPLPDCAPHLGPCWLWKGQVAPDGYGHLSVHDQTRMAHRLMYEHLVGPIPDGLQLDHLCRVRHCVNPAHLEPVTPRENTMRGNTAARANSIKTHCPRGHEYTLGNTYIKNGSRHCRACSVIHSRAWKERQLDENADCGGPLWP